MSNKLCEIALQIISPTHVMLTLFADGTAFHDLSTVPSGERTVCFIKRLLIKSLNFS
ncbi:hypothetical protein [Bartonella sp. CB189]|uniref:hypothetical protein n=1 Tax=Bartonella sp. CB189 TaxID=3112254 RepID=UPI002F9643AE